MLNRVDAKLQALFVRQNTISATQLVQALLSIGYEIQHVDNTVTIQPEYIFKAGDVFARGALFREMTHPMGVVAPPSPGTVEVVASGTIMVRGKLLKDAKAGDMVIVEADASQAFKMAAPVDAADRARAAMARAPRVPPDVADRLKAAHVATVQPRVRHRPKVAKKSPAKKR